MLSKFPKVNIADVKTISIHDRPRKVELSEFARAFDPSGSFADFAASLPDILAAKELKEFADAIIASRRAGAPVILMMGAHVIKAGCAPLIADLMRKGTLTAIAMNGAAAIHDVESALFGTTSEDVAENIRDGSFGMARETGDFINGALKKYTKDSDVGFGEAIGLAIRESSMPKIGISLCAEAVALNIPVTVHAAIGTDIIHQQPTMDGAVTGEMSFRDFRSLCDTLKRIHGGVAMNFGSAVILPEVFLKALTVARNLGCDANGFTTANFDMIQHYRPRMNVVQRPTQDSGKGYQFTGHHEIMLPLLAALIKLKMGK